jgi:hypothetical protein
MDFLPPSRKPGGVAVLLLALGVFAASWAAWDYERSVDHVAGLSLRLAQVTGTRMAGPNVARDRVIAEAQKVALELQTPWAAMLDDLESATAATKGDVSLLTVEPDRVRGKLKLTAEARSLPAALKYVQSLQHNPALRDALLENHQIRTDVAERPVRVQIVADWRISS